MTLSESDIPVGLRDAHPQERQEWNVFALESVIKESDGEYMHRGNLKAKRYDGMENQFLVAKKQLLWGDQDVWERIQKNERIIPVWTWKDELGDDRHVLTDADGEAVRLGYACPNCIEWQSVPGLPQCNWKYGTGFINGGCGHEDNQLVNRDIPSA